MCACTCTCRVPRRARSCSRLSSTVAGEQSGEALESSQEPLETAPSAQAVEQSAAPPRGSTDGPLYRSAPTRASCVSDLGVALHTALGHSVSESVWFHARVWCWLLCHHWAAGPRAATRVRSHMFPPLLGGEVLLGWLIRTRLVSAALCARQPALRPTQHLDTPLGPVLVPCPHLRCSLRCRHRLGRHLGRLAALLAAPLGCTLALLGRLLVVGLEPVGRPVLLLACGRLELRLLLTVGVRERLKTSAGWRGEAEAKTPRPGVQLDGCTRSGTLASSSGVSFMPLRS